MFRGGIEGWHYRWKDVILAIYGFLVQVIIPGGKRYFYIRAGLSRRELFNTITGRKFN
jgi:hypothetical protein